MIKLLKTDSEKLVLGTAQLGMDYGIANKVGKPDFKTAHSILDAAYDSGIRILDTAARYGNSEELIGGYLSRHKDRSFQIISKLDSGLDPSNISEIIKSVKNTYLKIGKSLAGMLIHDPKWLDVWDQGLEDAMLSMIEENYINACGVSVYDPEEFEKALNISSISIIQIPANIFDRRFFNSGLLEKAKKLKKTLFIRSVFLQGLLILPQNEVLKKMPKASEYIKLFNDLCIKYEISPAQAAINFISQTIPYAYIIIGCERSEQIHQNCKFLTNTLKQSAIDEIIGWPIPPINIINPVYWNNNN